LYGNYILVLFILSEYKIFVFMLVREFDKNYVIQLVCPEQSGTALIGVVPETGLECGGVDIPAVGVHDDVMT
jgi:hypothetical protein